MTQFLIIIKGDVEGVAGGWCVGRGTASGAAPCNNNIVRTTHQSILPALDATYASVPRGLATQADSIGGDGIH